MYIYICIIRNLGTVCYIPACICTCEHVHSIPGSTEELSMWYRYTDRIYVQVACCCTERISYPNPD